MTLLLAALMAVTACRREGASEEPAPPAPAPASTLVLGDAEANMPIRRIRWIQPLADHLAGRLAPRAR